MPGRVSALVARVEQHAGQRPGECALADGGGELSYRQLWDLARVLAELLAGQLRPNERLIMLRLRRTRFAAAAMLAVRMAGAAYLPLDPKDPAERHDYIAADSGATLLLTDGARAGEQVVGECEPFRLIRLDDGSRTGHQTPELPDDLAYVIYTSGSTGRPKGCLLGERGLIDLLEATGSELTIAAEDRWSVFHALSFDVSVFEIWSTLWAGGRGIVVDDEGRADPQLLVELLAVERVSVLSLTPTMLSLIVAQLTARPRALADLRVIVLAGEAIRPLDLEKFYDLGCAPGARFVNMYGITEATIHCTTQWVAPEQAHAATLISETTPIGLPLPHLRIELVAADGILAPDGQPGEIRISGSGVAAGYLRRPELTAERFLPAPRGDGFTLRTGDWAIREPDQRLHYLGRRDHQVKLQGYRIELSEVEAAVRAQAQIADCVCMVVQQTSTRSILACAVTVRDDEQLDPVALRAALGTRLPAYMVPRRFVRLDGLPITTNGKVDRTAVTELILNAS